jgi:hypothetical protein
MENAYGHKALPIRQGSGRFTSDTLSGLIGSPSCIQSKGRELLVRAVSLSKKGKRLSVGEIVAWEGEGRKDASYQAMIMVRVRTL